MLSNCHDIVIVRKQLLPWAQFWYPNKTKKIRKHKKKVEEIIRKRGRRCWCREGAQHSHYAMIATLFDVIIAQHPLWNDVSLFPKPIPKDPEPYQMKIP